MIPTSSQAEKLIVGDYRAKFNRLDKIRLETKMNQETYEALKEIIGWVRNQDKENEMQTPIMLIEDWIDEVAKDYDSQEAVNEKISI